MQTTLYRDFSDASVTIDIPPGVPLYESFAPYGVEGKRFIANGREVTPDYLPSEGDVIVARSIPGATAAIAILIVIAVVSVAAAGVAGYMAYKARKQAEEVEDALKGTKDEVKNLPYLRGSSNSIATGKTQPYVIGEHLFTPYLLTTPFHQVTGTVVNEDGANQWLVRVFQGGFAKQWIRELRADEVMLRHWSDGVPQEGTYLFDTTSPFYDPEAIIEVSQDGAPFEVSDFNIKVSEENPGTELKKSDDDDYEDLIFALPDYARTYNIHISFAGLRSYDDEGDAQARSVIVKPYYSFNSGASWVLGPMFSGAMNYAITRNSVNQMRFVAGHDFTYAQVKDLTFPVLVKLVCETPKVTGGAAHDQCYVEAVQALIYDPDASRAAGAFVNAKPIEPTEAALSTRIGIKVRATQSNQDKLDKINVLTNGQARTWSGSAWTTAKSNTRNAAAWLLEVLTSPTHKASQFADSEIDLDAFGELYERCETDNLKADLVLVDGDEKRNVLATLCDIANCVLYENVYGEVSVASDSPKANAIAVLNTQNMLSFEVEKTFGRRTDGIRVSYIARAGYKFKRDSYLVMGKGKTRTSTSVIRDLEATGRTEYAQVAAYARRLMAIEELRPVVARARVGREGVYYTPLAKVLVQHPALSNGLGSAEIRAVIEEDGFITQLALYEPIQYDNTYAYGMGVIIQAIGDDYSVQIAKEYYAADAGMVRTIILDDPIPVGAAAVPHPGDILSYGYLNSSGGFDTITNPMLITEIRQEDKGFTLSLVDYNEGIYDAGEIDEYTPNITVRKTGLSVPVGLAPVTLDDLNKVRNEPYEPPPNVVSVSAKASEGGFTVSFGLPSSVTGPAAGPVGIVLQYSRDDGTTWYDSARVIDGEAPVPGGSYYFLAFDREEDGYPESTGAALPWPSLEHYRFRAKIINAARTLSDDWTTSGAPDTSAYGTWLPAAPASVTASSGDRTAKVNWADSQVYGLARYEVQIALESADPTWYAPAAGLSPYDSEDNWRQSATVGEKRHVSISELTQVLPLEGQDEDPPNPVPTAYIYRVRAVSDREWTGADPSGYEDAGGGKTAGPWTSPVAALVVPKGAYDLAHGAILKDALSAENLAVLFGYIAVLSGGLEDENNRQILSDYPGRTLPVGYHRWGDSEFKVEFNPTTRKYYIGFVDGSRFIEFDAEAGTFSLGGVELKIENRRIVAYAGSGATRRAAALDEGALKLLNAPDGGIEEEIAKIFRKSGGAGFTLFDGDWRTKAVYDPDEVDFQEKAISATTRNWRRSAWSPELGLFVKVASISTVCATSPDGITWTERTISATARSWIDIVWSPEKSLFVAVSISNTVATSPDGETWTERTAGTKSWSGIDWSPKLGIFVVVAMDYPGSATCATSPDGVTWTEHAMGITPREFVAVRWAAKLDLFVAVVSGSAPSTVCATSPDGETWTERTISATARSWADVAWSESVGLFVMVAPSTVCATSPDGITWTERTISASYRDWSGVVYADDLGLFIMVAYGSAICATSPDGITWTERTISATARNWYGITWAPELGQFDITAVASTFCAMWKLIDYLPLNGYPRGGYVSGRGWWLEFANGTLIQFGGTGSLTTDTPVGNVYYKSSAQTFPKEFHTLLNIIPAGATAGSLGIGWAGKAVAPSNTGFTFVAVGATAATVVGPSYVAFGRWKA